MCMYMTRNRGFVFHSNSFFFFSMPCSSVLPYMADGDVIEYTCFVLLCIQYIESIIVYDFVMKLGCISLYPKIF